MTNVIARVKNLLLSPKTEWDVIDQEVVDPRKLLFAYVAPLILLPAATVVGLSVIGVDTGGEIVRAPWMWVAASASLFFALAILGVAAFAFVLDVLAPVFGARRNYAQALKVSGYSITAAMVAGIATIVPALGIVALIGAAYSLYLLFLGAPRLMKPAAESAVNYSIVATACAIGIGLVVGLAALATVGPSARVLFPQIAKLPGLAPKAPLGPLAAAAAAAAPTASGAAVIPAPTPALAPVGLVSSGALKAIVPEKLVGLDRVSLGVEASGLANAQSVALDAEYRKGKRFIDLTIVHSTTIAAVIGFGGPATSEYDRETAEGYSRRKRDGANIVVEEWNKASGAGSYGRLLGDEFYVRASGGAGVTPDELKQAVESFSAAQLAKLDRTP